MSTRRLIVVALLCGVAILLAGTFFLFSLDPVEVRTKQPQAPTSITRR